MGRQSRLKRERREDKTPVTKRHDPLADMAWVDLQVDPDWIRLRDPGCHTCNGREYVAFLARDKTEPKTWDRKIMGCACAGKAQVKEKAHWAAFCMVWRKIGEAMADGALLIPNVGRTVRVHGPDIAGSLYCFRSNP